MERTRNVSASFTIRSIFLLIAAYLLHCKTPLWIHSEVLHHILPRLCKCILHGEVFGLKQQ